MTIDEAIIKHIQKADSYHKAMPNYGEAADHRQLAEWLMELKDLRAEQNDQYVFIRELMDELKEAKRLLKVAMGDMEILYEAGKDEGCVGIQFKWRYADEALKLIGEELNGI